MSRADQLTDRIFALFARIDEMDGDEAVDELVGCQLRELENDITDTVESYAAVSDSLDAQADVYAGRAKILAARARTMKQRGQWLRGEIRRVMTAAGQSKISTASYPKIYLRTDHIVETDPDFADSAAGTSWVREVTTRSPDKTAIKAALRAGEVVPGARLMESVSVQWQKAKGEVAE